MKTAIVTGASGNLGQAVVKKFIHEGYKVIGTVVPGDATDFGYSPEQFEKRTVDLTDEDESVKFTESVITANGNIEAVVLTVGGFAMGKIEETPTRDITKQYQLNFETAYNIARPSFVQMMRQNSGRIFIIGSRPGLQAWHGQGMVAYGLAKSLLVRLAEIMNIEAKGHNVVTSVVVPSTIDTPQNRKAIPGADFNDWVKPEDIANTIYYHCTEEARPLRETVIKVYNNA